MSYLAFTLFWLIILYVLNCLIAGKIKRIEPLQALVYFSTIAMIGIFGEIFLDSIYNLVVGHPLWYYNIAPILDGYTSKFAIVTWGLYGFHLYMLHGSLSDRWAITKTRHLSLIIAVEALFLEALLTLSAKPFFGEYMYYYLPSDLWHVSSFQNIPFYFIFGIVAVKTLTRFRKDPIFFSALSLSLTFVLAFLAH